ncbi:MAG: FAD binding domain-containing protein [Spirochaetes bacterium]|nr:FAD binding domain-containing protein [Spirochaetota bacterium]
MITHKFEYSQPQSLDEAYRQKNQSASSVYIAGGTDIVPMLKTDLIFPELVISLKSIPELALIKSEGGNIESGAMATLEALAQYFQATPSRGTGGIANAARATASPQIRNLGTVGGNLLQSARCIYYNQTAAWRAGIENCFKTGGKLCHQAPAVKACVATYYSDTAPVFLACGAFARIYQAGRLETIPLEHLLATPAALGNGILTHVIVPETNELEGSYFRKQAVRGSIDFPLANAALALRKNGTVRLAVGAMTQSPVFLQETQAKLESLLKTGRKAQDETYKTAIAEAKTLMRPIREATVSPAVKNTAMAAALEVIFDVN